MGSVAVISKNENGNDCPPEDEAIGNAHLIAAAPDLYLALLSIVELPEGIDANYRGERAALDAALSHAKAALAKARGEQTE